MTSVSVVGKPYTMHNLFLFAVMGYIICLPAQIDFGEPSVSPRRISS